jgi:hypothetical protein
MHLPVVSVIVENNPVRRKFAGKPTITFVIAV